MHGVQPNAKARPTRIAPSGPAGLRVDLHALLAVQPPDPQHAHRVQAEDDDHDARRSFRAMRQPLHQELAERAGRGAERDEHEREAEDEEERGEEHAPARAGAPRPPPPRRGAAVPCISSSVTPEMYDR